MSRALVVIKTEADRQLVVRQIFSRPFGTRVEMKDAKRSLPQNSLLWALLTDVSRKVIWHGEKLTPDDWKDMFTAAIRKARVVPGIDPGSFVALGMRTSDMSKDEMSNLIELIYAFGAENDVVFSDGFDAGRQ